MSKNRRPNTTPLATYVPIAEALAVLFGPHVEVVLHDLRSGKIAHMANVWSGRKVGDESLVDLDISDFSDGVGVLGPYEKAGPGGERLRSITAVLRDDVGTAIGLLCVNLDLSGLDAATKLIADLFPFDTLVPRPEMLFRKDWREQVNLVIREFLLTHRKTIQRLDKTEREELIAEIESRGLLEMRHASQYVAAQLGISRATLYNALGRARKEPQRAKA
ncbi:helix-turn-helix transcriptional regulator [Hypericibacter sp.]|uniref:helix-turn-helix transcriptional regulator n=1 Tax=Hypericibacter sp. TaxID=2705401 RepID=UPI003D6D7A7D